MTAKSHEYRQYQATLANGNKLKLIAHDDTDAIQHTREYHPDTISLVEITDKNRVVAIKKTEE